MVVATYTKYISMYMLICPHICSQWQEKKSHILDSGATHAVIKKDVFKDTPLKMGGKYVKYLFGALNSSI